MYRAERIGPALPKKAKRIAQALSTDDDYVMDSINEISGYDIASNVTDDTPTPCEKYELTEAIHAIRRAVELLPRTERIAVSLYFGLDGLYERPFISIAQELDCSVEGARKAFERGFRRLCDYFGVTEYALCA